MKEFTQVTAYKCNKCGMIVEIPEVHRCGMYDVTACDPSSIPKLDYFIAH